MTKILEIKVAVTEQVDEEVMVDFFGMFRHLSTDDVRGLEIVGHSLCHADNCPELQKELDRSINALKKLLLAHTKEIVDKEATRIVNNLDCDECPFSDDCPKVNDKKKDKEGCYLH